MNRSHTKAIVRLLVQILAEEIPANQWPVAENDFSEMATGFLHDFVGANRDAILSEARRLKSHDAAGIPLVLATGEKDEASPQEDQGA